MEVDLSRALGIMPDWTQGAELQWLAEQASKHRCVVEIGSYLGRSTRAMCDNALGIVVAVDDFYGPREVEIPSRETIFERFCANMAGCEGRLVVVRENHRQLPPLDFQPDMVFIDGAHEYAAVKFDIEFWQPRLKPGGLLCGHDFTWSKDVAQAVRELVPGYQVAPYTSIWFKEME